MKISPHAALILPHHELGQAYPFDVFAVERRVLSEIRARFIEPILAAKTTAECERLLSDAGFLYGAGSRYVAMSYARSRGAEAMEEDLYRWVDFWITAPTASGWGEDSEEEQHLSYLCFSGFRLSAALVRAAKCGRMFESRLDAWQCAKSAARAELVLNAGLLAARGVIEPASSEVLCEMLRLGVWSMDETILRVTRSGVTDGFMDDRYSATSGMA